MEDLSLHILDIAENSIRANARNIDIRITEDKRSNMLTLTIEDDGKGMDEQSLARAVNPFFTTKMNKKVGLGLAFLSQSTEEAEGNIKVESQPDKGTKITATFKLGHIDRKPFGKLDETIKCLKVTHPDVNITFDNVSHSL